jgi:hypothetical protein
MVVGPMKLAVRCDETRRASRQHPAGERTCDKHGYVERGKGLSAGPRRGYGSPATEFRIEGDGTRYETSEAKMIPTSGLVNAQGQSGPVSPRSGFLGYRPKLTKTRR